MGRTVSLQPCIPITTHRRIRICMHVHNCRRTFAIVSTSLRQGQGEEMIVHANKVPLSFATVSVCSSHRRVHIYIHIVCIIRKCMNKRGIRVLLPPGHTTRTWGLPSSTIHTYKPMCTTRQWTLWLGSSRSIELELVHSESLSMIGILRL